MLATTVVNKESFLCNLLEGQPPHNYKTENLAKFKCIVDDTKIAISSIVPIGDPLPILLLVAISDKKFK